MERRFTALILPVLLVVAFLTFFQGGGDKNTPQRQAPSATSFNREGPSARTDDIWTKDFGAPGGKGYRVTFDNRAGAVREIRMLDHFVSLEARGHQNPLTNDYYPIGQMADRGVLMLLLSEAIGTERKFKSAVLDGMTDDARWAMTQADNEVRFTLDCKDGRTLEKVFRYDAGRADLQLELRLVSTSDEAPDAGQIYPLLLSGVTLPNPSSEHVIGGSPAYAIAGARSRATGEIVREVKRTLPPGQISSVFAASADAQIWWAGATNRFFAAFLYPATEADADALASVHAEPLPDVADPTREVLAHSVPVPSLGLQLRVPKARETTSVQLRVYLGPKSFSAFESLPDYQRFESVMQEDLTPPACFCTIPGVTFMATLLLKLLEFLHGIVGNWGLAIVLLTVLVKIAVFFLNFRSQKAMRVYGAKMARVKPEMDALQAKFKEEPKKLQQEMMLLYRKHKMFPPLGGCLPMFLTIPVFFGLFTALRVSYDLRHEPFLFWIQDLSAPDALFDLGFLGWSVLPHFNLLPLVWMALYTVMMFRQKLPTDPQQRTMQQMMRWMFLFFGVLLYNYASGLLVYMCTSMALAFVEQAIIKRILGPMPEAAGMASMPTL